MTSGEVEIYYVEGNHVTIMDDNKVAKIINDEPMEDAGSQEIHSWSLFSISQNLLILNLFY